jgi:hypothetical protein
MQVAVNHSADAASARSRNTLDDENQRGGSDSTIRCCVDVPNRPEEDMPNERDERGGAPTTEADRSSEYVKGGKGRKDEVGGSGIYPASSPDAPADAEVRSEGELVRHKGPRPQPTDEQRVNKGNVSSESE